jgi:hypothetical protein
MRDALGRFLPYVQQLFDKLPPYKLTSTGGIMRLSDTVLIASLRNCSDSNC